MNTLCGHLLFRFSLGIACLLFLEPLFAPATVYASCGEYVSYSTQTHHNDFQSSHSDTEFPCSGPSCQQDRSKPLLPPPSSWSESLPEYALFLAFLIPNRDARKTLFLFSSLAKPTFVSNWILDPPRG